MSQRSNKIRAIRLVNDTWRYQALPRFSRHNVTWHVAADLRTLGKFFIFFPTLFTDESKK